jgi:hypothetical protein
VISTIRETVGRSITVTGQPEKNHKMLPEKITKLKITKPA